jgi:putative addiction module component (TIGR02574 family)
MTQAVSDILEKVQQLSTSDREELMEKIGEHFVEDDASEVSETLLAELDRRVAQVESGEVALIAGEDGMAQIRRLVASSLARKNGE